VGYLLLITGGARSGKSAYAQQRAEAYDGSKCFIATCPPLDHEMEQRILLHQQDREGKGWHTFEEQLDIETVIGEQQYDVFLVDCLTLWVNNILYFNEKKEKNCTEQTIAALSNQLITTIQSIDSKVILVTNEVGMSIVPENSSARLYRDLVGRCNQLIGQSADEVVVVQCGVPLKIK